MIMVAVEYKSIKYAWSRNSNIGSTLVTGPVVRCSNTNRNLRLFKLTWAPNSTQSNTQANKHKNMSLGIDERERRADTSELCDQSLYPRTEEQTETV